MKFLVFTSLFVSVVSFSACADVISACSKCVQGEACVCQLIENDKGGSTIELDRFNSVSAGRVYSRDLKVKNKNIWLFQHSPFDSFEPIGRYYFSIIDMKSKKVLLSGYTDSLIEVLNLDDISGDEIVLKYNISGRLPINFVDRFSPEIVIYTWGCKGNLLAANKYQFDRYIKLYKQELLDLQDYFESKMLLISDFIKSGDMDESNANPIKEYIDFQSLYLKNQLDLLSNPKNYSVINVGCSD